jgi:hypothetical protein
VFKPSFRAADALRASVGVRSQGKQVTLRHCWLQSNIGWHYCMALSHPASHELGMFAIQINNHVHPVIPPSKLSKDGNCAILGAISVYTICIRVGCVCKEYEIQLGYVYICSQAVVVCSLSPVIYAQGEFFLMRRNCTCNCYW